MNTSAYLVVTVGISEAGHWQCTECPTAADTAQNRHGQFTGNADLVMDVCIASIHTFTHRDRQFIGNADLQFVMDVCITSMHTFTHTDSSQATLPYSLSWMCVSQAYIHSHTQAQFTGNADLQFIMDVCVTSIHTFTCTDTGSSQATLPYSLSWMCVSQAYMHSHTQTQFTSNADLQFIMDGCITSTHTCTDTNNSLSILIYNLWMYEYLAHSVYPQHCYILTPIFSMLLRIHPNIFS